MDDSPPKSTTRSRATTPLPPPPTPSGRTTRSKSRGASVGLDSSTTPTATTSTLNGTGSSGSVRKPRTTRGGSATAKGKGKATSNGGSRAGSVTATIGLDDHAGGSMSPSRGIKEEEEDDWRASATIDEVDVLLHSTSRDEGGSPFSASSTLTPTSILEQDHDQGQEPEGDPVASTSQPNLSPPLLPPPSPSRISANHVDAEPQSPLTLQSSHHLSSPPRSSKIQEEPLPEESSSLQSTSSLPVSPYPIHDATPPRSVPTSTVDDQIPILQSLSPDDEFEQQQQRLSPLPSDQDLPEEVSDLLSLGLQSSTSDPVEQFNDPVEPTLPIELEEATRADEVTDEIEHEEEVIPTEAIKQQEMVEDVLMRDLDDEGTTVLGARESVVEQDLPMVETGVVLEKEDEEDLTISHRGPDVEKEEVSVTSELEKEEKSIPSQSIEGTEDLPHDDDKVISNTVASAPLTEDDGPFRPFLSLSATLFRC